MNDPEIDDVVTDAEKSFPFSNLLKTDYFQKYRQGYYSMRDKGYQIGPRNYLNLLDFISEIDEYNASHARSFAKRLKSAQKDWKNAEAIFSEIIVYRYYLRLVYEGLIKSIGLNEREGDIIVERLDGTKMYLEILCVMPNFKVPEKPGDIVVRNVKTHTQEDPASIRQKILRKIQKQNQMTQRHENYAVIELNDTLISGDFSVLSSLSGGYKVTLDKQSGKITGGGYDWADSIFSEEDTENIKGIIYFSKGAYESRKFINNHNFYKTSYVSFSEVEKEIIFLKAVKELIDTMVNYEMIDLIGDDPDSSISFKTRTHQQLFYIILVDFLSTSAAKIAGQKLTYLNAIQYICDNPCFDSSQSIENLKMAAQEFSDWLKQEVQVDIWMPSIEKEAVLSLKRSEFIYICGNISKHNFTRLTGVAKKLCSILKHNNIQISFETALLLLDDFYERFHEDILTYHGSTIAELLNNIRWGIHEYLQPELSRSIIWEGGEPPKYRYAYPLGVTNDFVKHCYWELMNEIRREPFMRRFKITRYLQLRY